MGVLKNLFLGVYASNAGIRLLFLPLCYAFIISPFAVLFARKYNIHQKLIEYIPEDYKTADRLPQLFLSLVPVILATRLISGRRYGAVDEGRKRRVQLLPYWIPGFRHCINVWFGGDSWFNGIRDSTVDSIVGYNLSGSKRNIVLSSSLLGQILNQSDSLEETDLTKRYVPNNAFGMPSNTMDQYARIQPAVSKAIAEDIFRGEQMKKLVSASLTILAESLPDFITFNSSIVDQMAWERVADVELTESTVEAECELFPIVNEFFCNTIITPITGPQFPESYPLLASDLATINQSFFKLAIGVPRLFPLPGLPGAVVAKKRLLQNLVKFYNDLSSPSGKKDMADDESQSGEEADADTPTPLTALNELFSKYKLPSTARAAITLELLHGMVSRAVPLAFWTLLHIFSLSSPLSEKAQKQDRSQFPVEKIRQETSSWAEAIQPPAIHPSFPAPPEIHFALPDTLFSSTSFPYVRSCINEARRLYNGSLATAQITKPITVTENRSARPGAEEQWKLDVGSYIDMGISQILINTSAANYLCPDQYIADRFLSAQTLAPLSSPLLDPTEEFTTALLIAFVAGVVQLWDVTAGIKKSLFEHWQEAQATAAGEKKESEMGRKEKVGTWVMPKAVDGANIKLPKDEVRVRIRRREGLDGPKTLRKGR
ncbi:hypothetical protein CC78DRAFT_535955 [Lojkania enalia]|uniref:Cytochrome P450 n=1 Tax=Lojkania enalia TaxID=147567 RepID=A0A9P4K4B2_9PLEO|nr:hypothetical protein CC78DRAFT_535955 [Didymosphaeria enalia]